MKIILLIPHLEPVSHDIMIDSDFQRKSLYYFRLFFIEPSSHPCLRAGLTAGTHSEMTGHLNS